MRFILLYTFVFACTSTSLKSQNWEEVDTIFSDANQVGPLFNDTIEDCLYVGGQFRYKLDSVLVGNFSLARIKDDSVQILDSTYGNVLHDIIRYKGKLYFAGFFRQFAASPTKDTAGNWFMHGGIISPGITRMNNDSFEVVNPVDGRRLVRSLGVYDNQLILGTSDSIDDQISAGVLAYDGTRFSTLDSGVRHNGFHPVYSLCTYENLLFAGGNFYDSDSTGTPDFRSSDLQQFSDSSWNIIDGWLLKEPWGHIYAMEVYKGELYIGGYFREQSGDIANSIVKYDGTYFYRLGEGLNDASVYDFKVYGDYLYVCGNFDSVDGHFASSIAKWDGSRWCNLSLDSIHRSVYRLEFYHDTLYAIGNIHNVNSDTLKSLIRWIGDPKMEGDCDAPSSIEKVNYNLGFTNQQLNEFRFSIYPNPASDQIRIGKLKNSKDYNYQIINAQGQKLQSGVLESDITEIDVSSISSGIYTIIIQGGEHKHFKHVVIE